MTTLTTKQPKQTKTQQRRAAIEAKIKKLPTDEEGKPYLKPVTVGQTTVPILTVINHNYWAFVVEWRDANNERQRKTFADPDEAVLSALALANGKAANFDLLKELSPEEIAEIAKVAKLLLPFCKKMGITLEKAIEEYIGAKALAGDRSLISSMKEYLTQPWLTKSKLPLPEVIKEFVAAKKLRNCKKSTLLKMYYVLHAFSRRIGNVALDAVTTEHIKAEIYSPTRKDRSNFTYYCELHGFFAWVRRNGYLRPDRPTAMDAVEAPLYDSKRPDIITPEEARRLFRIIKDPECRLYLALCLFSGGRAEELISLRGEKIAPSEFFEIEAEHAKKRKDKDVDIRDVLDAWLRPFYGRKGLLIRRESIQAKIANEIEKYNHMLQESGSSEPPVVWKRNWLRHSFATYLLHLLNDLLDAAEECDHEPATMASFYLVRVSKAAAAEYFTLTPEACGIEDWAEQVEEYLARTPVLEKRITRKRKPKPGVE